MFLFSSLACIRLVTLPQSNSVLYLSCDFSPTGAHHWRCSFPQGFIYLGLRTFQKGHLYLLLKGSPRSLICLWLVCMGLSWFTIPALWEVLQAGPCTPISCRTRQMLFPIHPWKTTKHGKIAKEMLQKEMLMLHESKRHRLDIGCG